MKNKSVRRRAVVLMVTALLPSPLCCQDENHAFRESVEEIIALSDESDPATIIEELDELKETPVDINSGDIREISRLFFLTEFQVMVLADHVRKNGNVTTLYELALLPAFDRNTVMLMAPYISLQSPHDTPGRSYGRTLVTVTASTRYITGEIEKEGVRSLLRVRHEKGRFRLGLTAENDPGEPFTFINSPGPDFLSGYLEYQGTGLIERIIVGDYALRIGEGIVFNSSRLMGAWLSSPSFMSGRSMAAPYASTDENNFFRGVSLMLGKANAGAVLFASSNRVDARILLDEDSTAAGVSNLVGGGLHVSESQVAAHNGLTETTAGLHLIAGTQSVRGGVTASATWFSLPFRPDHDKPEDIHAFDGTRLLNVAADFKAGTGPVLFFSEVALSSPGSWAATAGLRAKPSGRVTFNLLGRHFSPDYHAFHNGAFMAGSGSGNETGLAASLHLEAARHLFLTAGADHYRIPWPRYRSSSPSYGSRIEIRGEYQPRDDLSVRLSYTASSREYDLASETGIASSVTNTRRQAGFVLDCTPARGFRLVTRVSASFISPSDEKGYLLCQDFSFAFANVPLRLWFRYALCSSDGWDSRLYAWENDMHSSFSVPALYGEMTRSFIMLSWKPAERVELRVKYALTDSGKDPGTGLKQELKGQVRIAF
ncbi:hypothetical protein EG827_00580 [bacterium]|nr:hypothetical protein [bacterium]